VVRTVVSMVFWSGAPSVWDGPSIGSFLAGLLLDGISWVFRRAREHGGQQC
jgi:hypothetical protein